MSVLVITIITIKLEVMKYRVLWLFLISILADVIRLCLLSELSNDALEFTLLTIRYNSHCGLKSFVYFAKF